MRSERKRKERDKKKRRKDKKKERKRQEKEKKRQEKVREETRKRKGRGNHYIPFVLGMNVCAMLQEELHYPHSVVSSR